MLRLQEEMRRRREDFVLEKQTLSALLVQSLFYLAFCRALKISEG